MAADNAALLFDPQTRMVVLAAKREAQRRGHGALGTGHLLMALTGEWATGLRKVLAGLGVTPEQIEREVETGLAAKPADDAYAGVQLAPSAKQAIALAKDAAQQSGFQLISAAHLFVGLIREGEDAGFRALRRLLPDLKALEQAALAQAAASSPEQQLVLGALENVRHELRVVAKNQVGLFREIRTLQIALEEQMHTLKQLISARRADRTE